MPMFEATEYERFSLDDEGQTSLTLEEAVKKARDLRKGDSANFYRVEVADDSHTTFHVKKVPVTSAYADFVAQVAKFMGRYVLRSKRK